MSVSSTLDIQLLLDENHTALGVVESFLESGWNFNYEGSAFYLPLGDIDDFDWQCIDISDHELLNIIKQKEEQGELIGVGMLWRDTGIGGEFLVRANGLVSIVISINKMVTDYDITDISWYLDRTLPLLKDKGFKVVSVIFTEYA